MPDQPPPLLADGTPYTPGMALYLPYFGRMKLEAEQAALRWREGSAVVPGDWWLAGFRLESFFASQEALNAFQAKHLRRQRSFLVAEIAEIDQKLAVLEQPKEVPP